MRTGTIDPRQVDASPELRRIMGTRARAAFEQRWDREIAVANWQRILEELIGSEVSH